MLPVSAQASVETQPFHRWLVEDGSCWVAFHRSAEGYLLRFPDIADFGVSPDGLSAWARPVPGASPDNVRHIFDNQVLPLALSQQGRIVLHGSAVKIGDAAVGFLGASGRGKSTLAASFAAAGHAFLSDDLAVIAPQDETYVLFPSHPVIRLWDDSEGAVLGHDRRADEGAVPRKQLLAAAAGFRYHDRPLPLRALFLLDDGAAPEIRPITRQQAMIELTRVSFLLDVEDRALLKRQFEACAALASAVPVLHLVYPRDYHGLGRLREAVLAHCSQPEPVSHE